MKLTSSLRRGQRSVLCLALVASVGTLVLLAREVREEIRLQGHILSENAQFSSAKPDADLMRLQLAAHQLSAGTGTEGAFLRLYDTFCARIAMMRVTPYFTHAAALPEFRSGLTAATTFLEQTEGLLTLPPAALRDHLPGFIAAAEPLQLLLRDMTLRGEQDRIRQADERRRALRDMLMRLILSCALFLAALMLTVLALARMVAQANHQTARLHRANVQVRAIIAASQDAIVVFDHNGRITDSNDAAARLFRLPAEALRQVPVSSLLPALEELPARSLLPGGVEGMTEIIARRPDGTAFPAECSVSQLDSDDAPLRICFLRDISNRLKARAELVYARDQAVAGERARAEVLAVMSHEMRTPLNGILGTLELIDEDTPPQQRDSYARIIRSSAETLLRHVNDVLHIASMEAMRVSLRQERFDANVLMSEILHEQTGTALRKGNTLRMSPCDSSLRQLCGDQGRLRQILQNLISNAVKFTNNGEICLTARRLDGDLVLFEVTDTGIGIAAADLTRIFGDFVTLNTQYNRDSQGTGLGLAISRRLAELMGGRLEVESTPGKGSVFRLTLPLPQISAPEVPPPDAGSDAPSGAPAPKMSLLVVEDNPINRFVLCNLLQLDGHDVVDVESGLAALEQVRRRKFDLILMDISMPGLDGLETTRRIRSGSGPNAATPVVAVTAHTRPADLERFRKGGIACTLTKPLRKDDLRRVLATLAPAPAQPGAAEPPQPDLPAGGMTAISAPVAQDLRRTLGEPVYLTLRLRMEAELQQGIAALPALAQKDPAAAADSLHKMAGSAAVFGMSGLHAGFARLETALRDCAARGTPPAAATQSTLSALPDAWIEARTALLRISPKPVPADG